MTIERKHTAARMSQIVSYGDTVYLAGQVAVDAAGQPAGACARCLKPSNLDKNRRNPR